MLEKIVYNHPCPFIEIPELICINSDSIYFKTDVTRDCLARVTGQAIVTKCGLIYVKQGDNYVRKEGGYKL